MLIPNHPDDERLSALASHETDATADAMLTAHVASCDRCTGLIDELGALRAALADLPDVAPARPLRLLPPVEAEPASASDRLGGWARRFFAPVLASGAALALVGAIGTAAPSFSGQTSGGAGDGAPAQELAAEPAESEAARGATEAEPEVGDAAASTAAEELAPAAAGTTEDSLRSDAETLTEGGDQFSAVSASPMADSGEGSTASTDRDADAAPTSLVAERSPWPMVLFAGVALMIGALVLRWILVPRAG